VSTVIGAGSAIAGTLYCPSGKLPVGGGWTTADGNPSVKVTGSGLTDDGLGWTGGMHNQGTTGSTLTLTLICVNAGTSAPAPLAAAGEKRSGTVFREVKVDD